MPRIGSGDAAFLNQIVKDLQTTKQLPAEVSQQVQETIRDVAVEGFITDKMLRSTWEKATGHKPDSETFARLRAEVFFALLAKEGYLLDDTKVRGDTAQALRLLATTDTVVTSKSPFLQKALGGPVTEVDVSTSHGRIYLRTADSHRGAYMPTDGLAVIYHHGDSWELALPDDTRIDLAKQKDPDLLLPAERKLDADARAAVRELLVQYLGLPVARDTLVKINAHPEDIAPEAKAFAQSLLDAIDQVEGKSTAVAPVSLDQGPATDATLTGDAVKVIHAFRDGELNFLSGSYASDYDTRVRGRNNAQAGVADLVGFVVGGKAQSWGLEQLAKAENDITRAHLLVNGFHDDGAGVADRHIERHKLAKAKVPAFVKKWLERNQRAADDWISMAGPNRHIDALKGKRVDLIKVDGEIAGYAAFYQERDYSLAAVFDASGKLLDPRTLIRD
ncbi:MAG: hypothetical protein JXR83_19945 [Deltaproteobacteria bacterium]|nr:hypothetical protein [Deltaproteobacteria bacterium]